MPLGNYLNTSCFSISNTFIIFTFSISKSVEMLQLTTLNFSYLFSCLFVFKLNLFVVLMVTVIPIKYYYKPVFFGILSFLPLTSMLHVRTEAL